MKDSCPDTIQLEQLVEFYIQYGLMKGDPIESVEKQQVHSMLRHDITRSIRKEIQISLTKDEADAMRRNARAMQRQQEMQRRAQQIRNLLFEGILFSFFVGLLVNLASELVNTLFANHKVTVAIVCLIIIAILYFYRLFGQIQALINPDQEGDSDPE